MNTLQEVIRPVRAVVYGRTDPGSKRVENQDSFLVADLSGGTEAEAYRLDSKQLNAEADRPGEVTVGPAGLLLLVADGMGGAAAGGVASELATSYTYEELLRRWLPERDRSPQRIARTLRATVEWANARVHERSQQHVQLHGMGTTMTAAVVLDGVLYIGQVGDSRAYLLRNGKAAQLTRDQSMVQQMITAGLLSPEEAEHSQHRNVILQALGIADHIDVEITYQQLRRGDVAVLCSDGLSGLVKPDEIASLVADAQDLVAACRGMVELANERGGPDNITVVVGRFDGPGLDEAAGGEPVGHQVFTPPES